MYIPGVGGDSCSMHAIRTTVRRPAFFNGLQRRYLFDELAAAGRVHDARRTDEGARNETHAAKVRFHERGRAGT